MIWVLVTLATIVTMVMMMPSLAMKRCNDGVMTVTLWLDHSALRSEEAIRC